MLANLIIKRSTRRKTISLVVYPDQRVVVSAPASLPEYRIMAFVQEKADWIRSKLAFKTAPVKEFGSPKEKKSAVVALQAQCLIKLTERLAHYSPLLGVTPKSVQLKNYKSRWGVCKVSGDLVFNWRLILATDLVFDYVVVHELSHLRQFNHSRAFWATVGSVFPRYQEARKELRLLSLRGDLDF